MEHSSVIGQLEEQASALDLHDSPQDHTATLRLSVVCRAADIYTRVFRATGDETAIDVALGLYRAALAVFTQQDSQERLFTMNCLAYALRISFVRRRNPADLEESIRLSREAIALSSSSSSEATCLWNLGASLRMAYQNLSGYNVDHLHEAISLLRQAVAGHCHPRFSSLAIVDLGSSLVHRGRCSGDDEALKEAVALLQKICEAEDVDDADRIYGATFLMEAITEQIVLDNSMSKCLIEKYLCMGRTYLTLQGDWQFHLVLMQTLATLFRMTSVLHGNISDIDEATRLLWRAIQLDPDSMCRKPQVLGNLGITLHSRFVLTGFEKDLEDAIKYLREFSGVLLHFY